MWCSPTCSQHGYITQLKYILQIQSVYFQINSLSKKFCFADLLKVHLRPFTHAFVCTGRIIPRMACIIFLALSSVSLLGVVRQGVLSYHKVPVLVRTVGIFLFCILFYFYKVHDPTPWTLGEILDGSAPILGVSAQF